MSILLRLLQTDLKAKNARLLEAISQNQDAKVRTQSWLLGVIEDIYMDVEARQRRNDKSFLPLGGATMPEIAFAYFHQKFGSKALVDEYIGSLNNTLLRFLKAGPSLDQSLNWSNSPLSTSEIYCPCTNIWRIDTGIPA